MAEQTKYTPTSYRLSSDTLLQYKKAFSADYSGINTQPLEDLGNKVMEAGQLKAEQEAKRAADAKKKAADWAEKEAQWDEDMMNEDELQDVDDMDMLMEDFNKSQSAEEAELKKTNKENKEFDKSLKEVEEWEENHPPEKGYGTYQEEMERVDSIDPLDNSVMKKLSPYEQQQGPPPVQREDIDYLEALRSAISATRSRGGIASRQSQLEFENICRNEQINYNTGDPQAQTKSVATLVKLGSQVKSDIAPGGVIETAMDVFENPSNSTPDYVLGAWAELAKQESVKPVYDEYDNLKYIVDLQGNPVKPGEAAAEAMGLSASQMIVDNEWMNKTASNYGYPYKREKEFVDAMLSVQEQARSGGSWNDDAMVAQSKAMINKDNLPSIFMDPTFGSTKSLYDQLIEAKMLPNLNKKQRVEWLDKVKNNPEMFEEAALLAARGIAGILKSNSWDVGNKEHKKENTVKNPGSGMGGVEREQRFVGTPAQMLEHFRTKANNA